MLGPGRRVVLARPAASPGGTRERAHAPRPGCPVTRDGPPHHGERSRLSQARRRPWGRPAAGARQPWPRVCPHGRRGRGGPPRHPTGTPVLGAGGAALLATRRTQRLGDAVSHGRWSGGGLGRRGREGVRGPASAVAWSSCLRVPHMAATVHRESGTPWASSLGVGHTGLLPRACAQAQSRKAGRREGTPRAEGRAHAAPNNALEPTPTASARASLRLLARLTASVRCQGYGRKPPVVLAR